ncbi:cell adhesion molecule 1-like [Apostichopus japonicus]|uniref:cell adhesion molecule 1-like n=1 Tax=Stichopus japonicus TaxID=307972 RepID=UPI003AB4FF81
MKLMDIILCILCMLSSLLPVVEAEPLKPSVLALEGDAAEIVCPTIESYDSYFWRKGDSIYDSTAVASFVDGVPRADAKNYVVTANGTFFIKNVTIRDEGKYFCRGVSVLSSSTVEIIIHLQASLQNFDLSIDLCSTESSCLRYINLSEPIELICRAKNASPSVTLKWFNGSREIESNITVVKYNQKDVPSSSMIISTLKAVYRTPVTLTCQAVDTKCRTDGGKFVNIRLEQQVPITNEKPPAPDPDLVRVWMIIALSSMGMLMLMFMLMLMLMHRRERYLQNGRPSVRKNGSVPTTSVPISSNLRLSMMSEGE